MQFGKGPPPWALKSTPSNGLGRVFLIAFLSTVGHPPGGTHPRQPLCPCLHSTLYQVSEGFSFNLELEDTTRISKVGLYLCVTLVCVCMCVLTSNRKSHNRSLQKWCVHQLAIFSYDPLGCLVLLSSVLSTSYPGSHFLVNPSHESHPYDSWVSGLMCELHSYQISVSAIVLWMGRLKIKILAGGKARLDS